MLERVHGDKPIITEVMETKELPFNCTSRKSVWVYTRAIQSRFHCALVIYLRDCLLWWKYESQLLDLDEVEE
jgi:hypothetical protein